MPDNATLNYNISDPLELNLSYMPFVVNGGLFIPTSQMFSLGDKLTVNLQLPGKKDPLKIESKVIWLTPKNALHHVLPGVGVQFIGVEASTIRSQIEASLDLTMDTGGYTYGITEEIKTGKS